MKTFVDFRPDFFLAGPLCRGTGKGSGYILMRAFAMVFQAAFNELKLSVLNEHYISF